MVDIEGFPGYGVTRSGAVISIGGVCGKRKGDRILSHKIDKDGYSIVGLCNTEGRKHISVHRLVAMAYIGNPDNLPLVNHLDEDKSNNEYSNLEWCTTQHNTVYSQANRSWLYKGTEYTTQSVSALCKTLGVARSTFYRHACSI
tara:strand:- start:30 stop:461 length:432 start_codon:yes stop_codon:yes gene_type:complete